MQKYDWRRLFSEVRPTFLPYAGFMVQTRLSPEECRQRLSGVTQWQRMLVPVQTANNPRFSLKGRVSKTGFVAVAIGHQPLRGQNRTTKPFLLFGRLRPVLDGTAVTVQVVPDVCCLVIIGAVLALVSWPMIQGWILHDTFMQPLLAARLFVCYGVLTLPVSFEAYFLKKRLKSLLA